MNEWGMSKEGEKFLQGVTNSKNNVSLAKRFIEIYKVVFAGFARHISKNLMCK